MIYVTQAGDVLDQLCYTHYRSQLENCAAHWAAVEWVLQHNLHLSAYEHFLPPALVIDFPDLPLSIPELSQVTLYS